MNSIIRRGTAVGLIVAACALVAGCDDSYLDQSSARSQQPISSATLAEMEKLDTTPSSPTVIRTYKKEAELEIWKMRSNGEYALLKTDGRGSSVRRSAKATCRCRKASTPLRRGR
jgi:murein L,D-transpeptidase YafK